MNTLKTVFLMTFMMVLLMLIGSMIGGEQGLVMAFVFSLLMNFGSYWFSDKGVENAPMENPSPSTAHLFIVSPLFGGGVSKLFSTHPPLEERIDRLQKIVMGGI